MSAQKGTRQERVLVTAFYNVGWFAQRTAASGSATTHELPDLIAANGDVRYVIELKYSGANNVYIEQEKVGGLLWLAAQLDAKPRLAARWKQDKTFYAYHPANVDTTPSGNYVLRRSDRDVGEVLPPPDGE